MPGLIPTQLESLRPALKPGYAGRRAWLAAQRLPAAWDALANCHLCAHHCGVNRWSGARGVCQAGHRARIFSAQVEVSDELEFIPVFAVAFSGCDLRCSFCVTGAESWDPSAGRAWPMPELVRETERALDDGARSIMILGGEPTIHLPAVLEFMAALPREAFWIWKTNAHGSAQARKALDGLFDVWLADYKFGGDQCAMRLAKVPNYTQVVRENLLWAHAHSTLVVRHLLMPGHVDCCWAPVAAWLAEALPGLKVSLRSGFWPAWRAALHPELRGTVTAAEAARAQAIAKRHRLNLIP